MKILDAVYDPCHRSHADTRVWQYLTSVCYKSCLLNHCYVSQDTRMMCKLVITQRRVVSKTLLPKTYVINSCTYRNMLKEL